MKIIRYNEIKAEKRDDGREIFDYARFPLSAGETRFFKVKIPKGVAEKEHYHSSSSEIFLFLEPGKVIINDISYNFEEGDMLILEKNDRHKIIAENDMELIGIKNPELSDKVVIED